MERGKDGEKRCGKNLVDKEDKKEEYLTPFLSLDIVRTIREMHF